MPYNREGTTWRPLGGAVDIHSELPPKNFTVVATMTGPFLQETAPGVLPEVLYGDTASFGNRILGSFFSGGKNMGILLVGAKGTGKTLQAQYIAQMSCLPVVHVNSMTGVSVVSSITQPIVVMLDEVEKHFRNDKDDQLALLALLDSANVGSRLHILTSNDFYKVNTYMIDRPERVKYLRRYQGIPREVYVAYVRNHVADKNRADEIIDYLEIGKDWSGMGFDTVTAVVSEALADTRPVKDAAAFLNIFSATRAVIAREVNVRGLVSYTEADKTVHSSSWTGLGSMASSVFLSRVAHSIGGNSLRSFTLDGGVCSEKMIIAALRLIFNISRARSTGQELTHLLVFRGSALASHGQAYDLVRYPDDEDDSRRILGDEVFDQIAAVYKAVSAVSLEGSFHEQRFNELTHALVGPIQSLDLGITLLIPQDLIRRKVGTPGVVEVRLPGGDAFEFSYTPESKGEEDFFQSPALSMRAADDDTGLVEGEGATAAALRSKLSSSVRAVAVPSWK